MVALKKNGEVLLAESEVALSFGRRFLGLMGKKNLPSEAALVFPRCNSIHTFFMCMPIDVVFVDRSGRVVRIFHRLSPWRMLWPVKSASHAIEMAGGRAKSLGISISDQLQCEGVF